MRRRLLSLLLTVVMVLGMLPVSAFAAEIPVDAPFTAITTDAGEVGEILDMATVDYMGYSTYEGVPYYHVQIPQGATKVYVTHPASEDPFADASYGSAYGYYAETEGWTGSGMSFAFEAMDDGYTITLPLSKSATDWDTGETTELSFVADKDGYVGYAVAVERSDYTPICFFTFEFSQEEEHACVYDQETVITQPTCTQPGVKKFTCICGEGYSETIAATGHSYADGTCETCGEADPEYVTAPFLSLALNGVELEADRIAYRGIFEMGDYDADEQQENTDYYDYVHKVPYYHVNVPCGTVSVDVTYPDVPPILNNDGKANGYATVIEGVDAVSSATVQPRTGLGAYVQNEDGTQTVTMPVTGYALKDGKGKAITVEKNGGDFDAICLFSFEYDGLKHVYTEVITKQPCVEAGVKTFTCTCGDSYTEEIEATGTHTFASGVCTACGAEDPDYHEHSHTAEVTIEPGCVTPGVRTFTCSCSDSYTEEIPATGHQYGDPVEVLATCAAQGSKTWTCDNCTVDTAGHTKYELTDKAAHSYDEGEVTTSETCTGSGVKTYTCTVCDEGVEGHTKTETIPATGHNYQDGKCENCGDICPVQDAGGVYQISTYEELLWFANAVNGGNKAISAALTADITLDADWPGIGDYTNRFAGSFDGQNHTVTLPGSTFGLFGYTMGTYDGNGNTKTVVAIQNVILDGTVQNSALIQNAGYTHITNCINKADITGGNANVAGIVGTVSGFVKYGQTYSDVLIQNCANEGNINGEKYTAGIVGYSQANTRLNSCSNTGIISGANYVGGLVGYLQEAKGTCEIKNSYNHGAVTGSSYVGGICGNTYNGVNIENCYNAGQCGYGITANMYNNTVSIINCYYQGTKSDKGVPDNSFTNISATAVTAVELSSDEFAAQLGSAYTQSCPAPVLSWQEAQSHTGMEADGICDVCGLGGNVKEEYKVTFPTGEGFTVTGEAAAIQGETYTFTLTVNNGYRKLSTFAVKVNGDIVSESTETADSYTVENVEGPLTITVEGVEKIPETLTVTLPNGEGKGYRVTAEVAGSTTVAYDGTFRFKVTMHENFQKTGAFQVLVNGSQAINPNDEGWYVLENVRENKTITVSGVEAKPYGDTADILLTITRGEKEIYETPQSGSDQMLLHIPMEVPYFDISLYGLNCYYNPDCYSYDEAGNRKQTAGNAETAYGIITPLHAFIYATEVHYLGVPADKVGTGYSYQQGTFQEAISWSGGVGSIFMKLWDHGTNLNYYVNYKYPLGLPGWGSTSDQIVLKDGDIISAHMIMSGETDEEGNAIVDSGGANGSAYGIFVVNDENGTFDYGTDSIHSYEAKQGEQVDLTLFSSVATSSYDTAYTTIAGQQLYWVHDDYLTNNLENWNLGEEMVTGDDGSYTLDTSDFEPGIYYIGALGGFTEGDGKADATGFTSAGYERGAAVLKLTITEGDSSTEEPEQTPGDLDGNGIVSASETIKIVQQYRNNDALTSEQLASVDTDQNGILDPAEFIAVIRAYKNAANS